MYNLTIIDDKTLDIYFPVLETINLSGSDFSPGFLSSLLNHTEILGELCLENCQIEQGAVVPVQRLRNLTQINLSECSDSSLSCINELLRASTALTTLNTDVVFPALSMILRGVNPSDSLEKFEAAQSFISEKELFSLSKKFPYLKSLEIPCSNISAPISTETPSFDELELLDIWQCDICPGTLEKIINAAVKLKKLVISSSI